MKWLDHLLYLHFFINRIYCGDQDNRRRQIDRNDHIRNCGHVLPELYESRIFEIEIYL